MTTPTRCLRTSLWVAAVVMLATGCTSSTASGPTGPKNLTPQAQAKDNEPVSISNRAKLLFEDAVKAFDAQKKSKAFDFPSLERKFKAALEADANIAEADYNLGVVAERQGKKEEAKTWYQSALKKKPSLRQASENLAVLAQNDGDIGGAVALYQDVLKRYPDDAPSRARLAEIYRQTGDHDRAMEFSRAALMREPQSTTALKVMMRSYLDRKQLAMAKLVALRALKLDENDPELHHTIGLILQQEGDADGARLQFKSALETRADYVPSHVVLAQLALEAEDYPGAEEHLRRILQAGAKSAAAHVNLGIAYKGQGQYDKAMQEYDAAEKLDPKVAAIYLNRAIILHRAKDAPERAIELYKKYIGMAGGDVALNAEAPVFNLLREAEAVIQAKGEAQAAEAQAKQMEALQAEQQKVLKAEEDKQKAVGGTAANTAGNAQAPQTAPPGEAGTTDPGQGAPEQKNPAQADSDEPADDFM
ncbi:adventurous gliding motility TPR repeat lipoprotein GltE [Stigmatella sp. ncwal1]|uniref:Adventurous gliding motility TPR repeat lipoprotein GltE n=1 Tax=Stigmatella ashevillensis TaxID=2995309 RepID=A0ABT5D7G9_9BACT|nr:adventurous gliding motility TPR repeat lipoprotein GltE [Stigmatella ashevillena]MDC0709025.1 adventurous gliding motility TPR repeat lipoprotein GltE [Stigmatella ashevillena]